MENFIKRVFAAAFKTASYRAMVHSSWGGGSGPGGMFGTHIYAPGSDYDYSRQAGDLWKCSAVAACLRVLKSNFPAPELTVQKRGVKGNSGVVNMHPLPRLFDYPNPGYDRTALWGVFVLSAVVDGNAYLMKVRSPAGVPVQLWWIPPWMMRPVWDLGDPYTWISRYEYYVDGVTYDVDPADVIHFRQGIDPRNDRLGRSELKAAAARTVCSINECDGYTASILRNMGIPGVVIAPEGAGGTIQESDAKNLKAQWRERLTGENRGGVFIASGPIKISPVSMTPEQMRLDSLPARLEDQICALTGVNPMVAGLTSGAGHKTYNNMQESRRGLYEDTIMPMQAAVAECLEHQLLGDPGMGNPETEVVRFSYSGVQSLTEDQDKLYNRAISAWTNDFLTRKAAKEMIGVATDPDDDIYYTEAQVAMKPAPPPVKPVINPGAANMERDPFHDSNMGKAARGLPAPNGHAAEGDDRPPFTRRLTGSRPRSQLPPPS